VTVRSDARDNDGVLDIGLSGLGESGVLGRIVSRAEYYMCKTMYSSTRVVDELVDWHRELEHDRDFD
jgi:hypothetical protein